MSPLPPTAPDRTGALNSVCSTISSLFKFNPSAPALFSSSCKEGETLELTNLNISSSGPPPVAHPPSKFALRPPGPQKEAWWETPDLWGTDGYAELTSNSWKDNRRRSRTFPPSIVKTPMALIYKTVPDQEPASMTMNRTTPVPQPVKGEHRLTYSQGIGLIIFIWLATIVTGGVLLWAVAVIQSRLLARLKKSGGPEQKVNTGTNNRVMYIFTALALGIVFTFGSFALWELLSVGIWKA